MMTFDEKLINSVKNFEDVSKPDYTKSELNYYADFVELMTIKFISDGLTLSDVQDRFFGEKDYENAEKRDKDEVFLKNIFLLIEERISSFGNDYPFTYDSVTFRIKEVLSSKNKLYLSLLFSSKLNLFKDFKTELTTEFEIISYNVLKGFLPANAIIKKFGRNSDYTGNAIDKIKQLAHDLDLDIKEYDLSCVNDRNQQERGLDLIGWIPFKDVCRNKIIFLAQCACGKEYESKQHDTRRFKNYIDFYKTKPQHTMFIPFSLVNVRDRKFYHSDLLEDGFLIFERKRIVDFYDEQFENSISSKIVDDYINYYKVI